MLASLLRRIIITQLFFGGLLGWWVTRKLEISPGWATIGALMLPVVSIKLIVFIAAVRAYPAGTNPMLWWRSIVGENWSTLRLALLEMPWTFRAPAVMPALGAEQRIPMVLVHGYVCNHRIFDRLTVDLRRAGHPVLAVDLEPLFTSIDDYTPLVEQAVERLCKETGAAQVALVGHSMGGLVIRAWMREYGSARVARVLTLGTPHSGTKADPFPFTPNSRQMVWQSPWLKALTDSESLATHHLMQIALSPQDAIVFPQQEQVLPGAAVEVFEGLGHIELCFNPQVRNWIVGQLDIPKL
ncbi:triacylglycerol lipase [Rhodoferax sp. PAMC 29310]|uniref:esterase/lipase family protein n=1 Tax=Rhodoferax sp. PAMC 29310 TaxID=2822760 RepID=UPI001B3377FB|nr:alpha/beta fold hydrolase [Rhodoferax sp. PAMC 29310]